MLNLLNTIFEFIATDITNPMNLFVYGVMDRLLADLNLGALMRTLFWYGEQGGTWINNLGVNYMGDVGIWTAQMNSLITPSGVGRLITPYYVLNLFAVPGMLIGFYTIFTDKMEKRRIRLFFLLAILVSLVTGTPASAGTVSVDSDPVVVCLPSGRHRRVVRYLPVDERDTGLQLYRQHRHRHAGDLI